ncbi:MAG: site-specific integrase [Paludibacter sp.]
MGDYSISKCIRDDKPIKRNNKYPIYLRIRVFDKETKIPTGIDVEKDKWDIKRKEPKDRALAIILNKKIADLEQRINRALADDQLLSIDLIKDFYAGKKKVKPENTSFYEYYLDFVQRKRNEGLNSETIRVYMTTYNVLKTYLDDFLISDINLTFIEEFDDYMRDVNGNANGGRNPKHKNLRTVILDMQKHDIPIKNPYKHFKIPQPNVKEVFLEKHELELMRSLRGKFSHSSKSYKVLQMYLFSCYCGLRFSDVIELKWSHVDLENNLIIKIMRKTQSEVQAPIFRNARAVLLELSDSKKLLGSDKLVFQKYAEPTVNSELGKLAAKVEINKHITFHSSRHTFATLLVIDETPIYTIQKFLGHKSVNTTERYLKYDLKIAKESAYKIKTFG